MLLLVRWVGRDVRVSGVCTIALKKFNEQRRAERKKEKSDFFGCLIYLGRVPGDEFAIRHTGANIEAGIVPFFKVATLT